ncbi:hypothetical protein AKJ16_DCAP09469 [Drosera capensis]
MAMRVEHSQKERKRNAQSITPNICFRSLRTKHQYHNNRASHKRRWNSLPTKTGDRLQMVEATPASLGEVEEGTGDIGKERVCARGVSSLIEIVRDGSGSQIPVGLASFRRLERSARVSVVGSDRGGVNWTSREVVIS